VYKEILRMSVYVETEREAVLTEFLDALGVAPGVEVSGDFRHRWRSPVRMGPTSGGCASRVTSSSTGA
jgi:hypothetical protein